MVQNLSDMKSLLRFFFLKNFGGGIREKRRGEDQGGGKSVSFAKKTNTTKLGRQ